MDGFLAGAGMALWLGIMTSISPCPLTTNIVAISYIGKRVDNVGYVALSGLAYALGRTLVYVAIGAILVASILSVQEVAIFLEIHEPATGARAYTGRHAAPGPDKA